MALEGDTRVQRVRIVSGAGLRVLGGPATPIRQMPANTPHNGAPVLVVTIVTDNRAVLGGPVMPVLVVSSGGQGGDVLPCVLR